MNGGAESTARPRKTVPVCFNNTTTPICFNTTIATPICFNNNTVPICFNTTMATPICFNNNTVPICFNNNTVPIPICFNQPKAVRAVPACSPSAARANRSGLLLVSTLKTVASQPPSGIVYAHVHCQAGLASLASCGLTCL